MRIRLRIGFRTVVTLFLFGAIVGNGYNSMHAYMGAIPITLSHPSPLLDWSSYLLFGTAAVAIGLLTLFFDRNLRAAPPAASWRNVMGAMVVLGVLYFCSAEMYLSNNVIFAILTFGLILCIWLYDRHGYALLAALIVAIIGTTAEVLQVQYQLYYYARPQWMGVPYWLPLLYAISSITTAQLARALTGTIGER